jgi:hypothetical protein
VSAQNRRRAPQPPPPGLPQVVCTATVAHAIARVRTRRIQRHTQHTAEGKLKNTATPNSSDVSESVPCVCVSVSPQVKQMSSEDTEHKDLFKRNLSHGSLAALAGQVDAEAEFTVSRDSLVAASGQPPGASTCCHCCPRRPAAGWLIKLTARDACLQQQPPLLY